VEELVEGVQGVRCEQLTARIEARLGTVQQRRSTTEAYQVEPLAALDRQSLHQQQSS
jgi:hypothetical protein